MGALNSGRCYRDRLNIERELLRRCTKAPDELRAAWWALYREARADRDRPVINKAWPS